MFLQFGTSYLAGKSRIIAVANDVSDRIILEYFPGMASIFGGLLLSIIIIRLGGPKLYTDCIVDGALQVGLGVIFCPVTRR